MIISRPQQLQSGLPRVPAVVCARGALADRLDVHPAKTSHSRSRQYGGRCSAATVADIPVDPTAVRPHDWFAVPSSAE